jgi:hypothetical protein
MSENVPYATRLPVAIDVRPLADELTAIPPACWSAHFNRDYHNGGWSGVALRANGADGRDLYLDAVRRDALQDTAILDRCPAIAAVLGSLRCAVHGARLLRLEPGGVIREHCDPDLRFEDGEARLHVPIVSNPDVEFRVAGLRVIMEPGECWFLDLSQPHRVANRGTRPRVHLVVDVGVNAWLCDLIARGDRPHRVPARPDGASEFARFREAVFADPRLAALLRADADHRSFVARTVQQGAAAGYRFSAEDVAATMQEGKRRWISQWTA